MIKFRERRYSLISYKDIVEILVPNLVKSAADSIVDGIKKSNPNPKNMLVNFLGSMAISSTMGLIATMLKNKILDIKIKSLVNLSNKDIIESLEKYRYKEGKDFTVGDKKSPITLHMNNSILLISMNSGYNDSILNFMKGKGSVITNIGKLTLVSFQPYSRNSLEKVLDLLVKYAKKINIYDRG